MSDFDDFAKELLEPTKNKVPKIAKEQFRGGSVEWDGTSGEIDSGAIEGTANWDDIIRKFGLDPAEVEIVEPVRIAGWEAQTPDGIQMLYSHRARLQSRRRSGSDIEQLLAEVLKHKPSKVKPPTGDLAFFHLSGDLQAGKEGSKEMIERFLQGLSTGPARLKELRRSGRKIGPVYLPWLGDCLEHVTGSYASQQFTVEMSLTEQIRLIRRLMLKMVQVYAPLTDELIIPVVPGNHDIAIRAGNKAMTPVADSFATEIASAVHDAIEMNPETYGHVKILVPEGNDPELTLDVCGTVTSFAHGHTFKRDIGAWWAGQALGGREVGKASLLMAGHLHHLVVRSYGPRTFIQIPALDSGSEWFAHSTGLNDYPGIVTLTVGNGSWDDFKVL